jgi:hypothetical protein
VEVAGDVDEHDVGVDLRPRTSVNTWCGGASEGTVRPQRSELELDN